MTDTAPIRLLLADDHPVVRAGLRAVLDTEPDFRVVAEAATAERAVALAATGEFDVVLMDLQFGAGLHGSEATAAITAAPDAPRVLILTTYDSDADILAAVEAGAAGYLLKDAPPEELAAAVRTAAAGRSALAPAVAHRLMDRMRMLYPGAHQARAGGPATGRRGTVEPADQQEAVPQPGDGEVPSGAHLRQAGRGLAHRGGGGGDGPQADPALKPLERAPAPLQRLQAQRHYRGRFTADASPQTFHRRGGSPNRSTAIRTSLSADARALTEPTAPAISSSDRRSRESRARHRPPSRPTTPARPRRSRGPGTPRDVRPAPGGAGRRPYATP